MHGSHKILKNLEIVDSQPEGKKVKDGIGNTKFIIIPLTSKKTKKIYGFKVINCLDVDLKMTCDLLIKPIDYTYSYLVRSLITTASKEKDDEN